MLFFFLSSINIPATAHISHTFTNAHAPAFSPVFTELNSIAFTSYLWVTPLSFFMSVSFVVVKLPFDRQGASTGTEQADNSNSSELKYITGKLKHSMPHDNQQLQSNYLSSLTIIYYVFTPWLSKETVTRKHQGTTLSEAPFLTDLATVGCFCLSASLFHLEVPVNFMAL